MTIYVNVRAFIERLGEAGPELLLQVRDRAGEPPRLELPGGRIEPFEPLLDALAREMREETGLRVVTVLDPTDRLLAESTDAAVECLTPFCAYQTVRGPVDSVGYYFRVRAEGDLTARGDDATGHHWLPLTEIARRHAADPDQFDWLTRAALAYYLRRHARPPAAPST